MDCLDLEGIRRQLLVVDHGLAHDARLLVESVFHEFILELVVLELLLLPTLPFKIALHINHP